MNTSSTDGEEEYLNSINKSSITANDLKLAKSYNISEFDPETVTSQSGLMLIISKTNTGKSVFITDLISKIHRHYDQILIFSPTAAVQDIYNFLPRSHICDHYDEELLTFLYEDKKLQKENGLELKPTLIILDDVVASPEFIKSKIINKYAISGRHYLFTFFILSQNFTSLKPIIRNNACWSCSFDLDSYFERKKFCEQFLSAKNTRCGMALFNRIIKEKPYQLLIVENYKANCGIEEKVKKYVADPDIKPFKIKYNPLITEKTAPIITPSVVEPLIARMPKKKSYR